MRELFLESTIKPPLFRFTKRKWANIFFRTGQLRLGTLFDYAKNESYGDAIHDRHEGYCAFILPKDQPIDGIPVTRLTLARNNLLLCFTDKYADAMYEEFNADCCIIIHDMRFFTCIDNVLRNDFTELLMRRVNYIDKKKWDSMPRVDDFAGITKDVKFSHQMEVRALWEPVKPHRNKVKIPNFTRHQTISDNFLINASEELWFDKYLKQECKWLQPKTIFVPEAIKYCSIKT